MKPDTILSEETTNRLLEAMKEGVIDMSYFSNLYWQSEHKKRDFSEATPEELERIQYINQKIKRSAGGRVVVTRELKIRLLNTIRLGRINLDADFPELVNAYRAVRLDFSDLTPEEDDFITNMAIANNYSAESRSNFTFRERLAFNKEITSSDKITS